MKKLEKSVPVIRFKGFSEAWEQRKLGEVFTERSEKSSKGELISVTISSGVIKASELERKDISSSDKSNYKVVKKGDIAYNSMRMWQGASGHSLFDGILSPAYTIITPKKNISSKFISYIFKKHNMIQNFQRRSQGLTSDTWNLKFPALSGIKVKIPNYTEQAKISDFFQHIDNTIALHQRKLDTLKLMKKGFLQQMFPNNDEEIPKVRFADFNGMWKQRKLNSITEKITRKNKELESTLPLTISAQDGLIDQNEYFNKIIASRNIRGYFLVKNGEFAYNKSYSKGYPWGVVKRLDNYNMGVLSTLYIIFKPVKINSDFLTKYFDSTYWYRAVSQFATEGARNHGLLNIAASDFFEIELNIPLNNEEQKKIGLFFQQLENIIILHQNKLEKLSILKKTYLKKMFI
ncbi:restriction endonuclease subunit S [Listeria monocytogenes]|nr:restriction endonuclease subunit S [Listeria monocytogenes]EHZ2530151.1 restriction endonuclease subunit S [Listeria monocytogenes]EIM1381125.1 restriction endonuclease subunit S [Listeria monocytogenes]EIZ2407937.1 restriction endonuclease subunit S [Listeria monocytogenes]EIZ2425328.1 restriction endonuclease subunit S [Listeria monocytogenes]